MDGPLLRALRLAAEQPVLLFIDELNRVPRRQVNLLLTVMNPKSGDFCRRLGLGLSGAGPYYLVEVPMTSQVLACPAANLRIVAAGNFGRAYAIYELDPALRRRFDTVIEFDYLDTPQELALLQARAGLTSPLAQALVQLAAETRRLQGNGELPGCIDTGSLLNWAAKCTRSKTATAADVMHQAGLTWADLVCGRDHRGRVNTGSFQALADYLESLGLLPAGGAGARPANGGADEDQA